MSAFEAASCPSERPGVGDSGKAALGGRFADRERRYLVESGRSGYGKADCDSRPCAALLTFPIGMVDWEAHSADSEPFGRSSAR